MSRILSLSLNMELFLFFSFVKRKHILHLLLRPVPVAIMTFDLLSVNISFRTWGVSCSVNAYHFALCSHALKSICWHIHLCIIHYLYCLAIKCCGAAGARLIWLWVRGDGHLGQTFTENTDTKNIHSHFRIYTFPILHLHLPIFRMDSR